MVSSFFCAGYDPETWPVQAGELMDTLAHRGVTVRDNGYRSGPQYFENYGAKCKCKGRAFELWCDPSPADRGVIDIIEGELRGHHVEEVLALLRSAWAECLRRPSGP